MGTRIETENKQSDPLQIAVGVLLCLIALLVNKLTLEMFCFKYVGAGLSQHNLILLGFANLYALVLGGLLIRRHPLIPFRCLGLLAILLLLIVIPYLLYYFQSGDFGATADFVYAELLGFVLLGFIILLAPRFGLVLSFILLSLICAGQSFYIYHYKSLPGPSTAFILLETNRREALGYIGDYLLSVPNFIFLITWACLCRGYYKLTGPLNRPHLRILIVGLIVPLLTPLFFGATRQVIPRKNLIVQSVISYRDYKTLQQEAAQRQALPLSQLDQLTVHSPRPDREVHVLVIGESADRDHMGVYGYHRQTTPSLTAMANDVYCFSNVIAAFLNTIPNMNALLTFSNTQTHGAAVPPGTMIHYLKKAGYNTSWLSNQMPVGMYETLTTSTARNCDQTCFVNLGEGLNHISYDQKLLAPLHEILLQKADRQYIFIHLMGQHNPYRLRYPPSFKRFHEPVSGKTKRQSEIINHYDNATIYNDYIIGQIIKQVRDLQVYSSVLYLSDHGLEVCEDGNFHGHSFDGGLEIPFILWVSEEYHRRHPGADRQFRSSVNRPYTSDDTVHSIFDLLEIRFDAMDTTRSIFSPDFRQRKRIIQTADHRDVKDYDAETREQP